MVVSPSQASRRGFWFVPHSGVDLTAAAVAFAGGDREKLRYGVVLTMGAGAGLGATLTRFTAAASAAIFWFGRAGQE